MNDNQEVLLQTKPTVLQQPTNVAIDNEHVVMTHNSGSRSLDATIKSLNIRIRADWRGNYMNFEIFVPQFICERSYGHAGTCDGNRNNDISIAGVNDCK